MNFKSFIQTKFGFVVINVAVAVVVAIIGLCILFAWLRHYTQHGVEVEMPTITGLQIVEAEELLAAQNLTLVIVDSTFSNNVPLGTIVEQTPPAGSHAKKDRSVYVMINSSCRRKIELPDLHDISYRQAQSTLRSLGFVVGNILYEPSEYKDIVLEVRCNGKPLEPGDKLQEGSMVTMVVGRGKGTAYVEVPSLQGKSLAEARASLIDRYHLTVGLIEFDEQPTGAEGETYTIYQQKPTPGTQVLEGTGIDIKLSADIEKALTTSEEEQEDEDFF